MRDIVVKCKDISKRFFILTREKTTLKMIEALLKKKSFFRERWVLRGVSFEINKGEKLAIIGRNGAGKTTLLRILTGIYQATSGSMEVSRYPKALFRFWTGFNNDLSVLDNIYIFGAVQGISRDDMNEQIEKILDTTELSELRFGPLRELSAGQIQRLALAIFFQSKSDFLIFDESLTFIDRSFYNKCEAHFKELSGSEKTLIVTSHDALFLRKHCNRAIWLEQGYIRMMGDINTVLEEYERFSEMPSLQ